MCFEKGFVIMENFKRVCLSLDKKTSEQLADLSARSGMSQSQFIKCLINALYNGEKLPYFIQFVKK